jgi:FtsH-binding integral membrane protein
MIDMKKLGAQTSSHVSTPEKTTTLRNVYGLLGISLLPTILGAWLGLTMHLDVWMVAHPYMALFAMMAVSLALIFGIVATRDSGLGVVFMLLFAGMSGLMLTGILSTVLSLSNGASLVMMAGGGTGVIFLAMAFLATVIKRDLGFLNNFLFVGLLLLMLLGIGNMFFQLPVLSLTFSAIAIGLFSAYLLVDVQRVINKGQTNYILATLEIYLDLFNIFVNLLNLLAMLSGRRD